MVPEGWEVKKIADFAKVMGGKRLPEGAEYVIDKTEHPYIRVTDFLERTISLTDLKYIDHETHLKVKRYIISKEDVYISIAGTVGIAGVIPEVLHNANLTENAAKICEIKNVDKNFLSYQINSDNVQQEILTYIGAAVQPKLALFRIEKLQIKIPSLVEQQQIASILSTLDRTIEATQKLIDKEKMVKKGLMADLLTHGIDEQGRIRSPQTHRYVDSPLRMIPEGWEVKHLSELADIVGGGTPAREVEEYWKNGNIPWATPTDITKEKTGKYIDHTEECITAKGLSSSSAKLIPTNSILLTSRANIGFMRLNTKPMATNQGFASVVPFEDNAQFLYYLLDIYVPYMHRRAYGTTFPEISKTEVKNIPVVIPKSIDEQQKIATILSAQDRKIETEETNLAKLQNLKKGLMGDLLSGKVRVKV
jgi:type I restriction enzyme S subunit